MTVTEPGLQDLQAASTIVHTADFCSEGLTDGKLRYRQPEEERHVLC